MGNTAAIKRISSDFSVADLDNQLWKTADEIKIERYWSARPAPSGRRAVVRLLWSRSALYVRFEAIQSEPLIVSSKPNLSVKTIGLWDRDVCEIFIAAERARPSRYFELEIAPNGEWIDLGIEVTPQKRITDWDYVSGMTSSVRIDKDRVVMAIKIPFASLGKTPRTGDVWLGNLFRCVGAGAARGYLAWRPTGTKDPAFHVPEAFGEFHFVR